jgi:hypothetical protein
VYARLQYLALLLASAVVALLVGAVLSEAVVRVVPALREIAVGPTDLGSWLGIAVLCAAFAGYSVFHVSRAPQPSIWRLVSVAIPPLLLTIFGWYRGAGALMCQSDITAFCGVVVFAYAAPVFGAIAGIWLGTHRPSNNKLQRQARGSSG